MTIATKLRLLVSVGLLIWQQLSMAAELGQFDAYSINDTTTRLAIIDDTEFSRQWLAQYQAYLIEMEIPVMILNSQQEIVNHLTDEYQGLILALAPEPAELLPVLFDALGIVYYPAVIEDGLVWQQKNLTQ